MNNNTYTKVTIVGAGYVGISLAALLSLNNNVCVLDTNKDRVNLVNNNQSTVEDELISQFFQNNKLNLEATTNSKEAYKSADIIIICTPTDYNEENNSFDTSIVDSVVEDALRINKNTLIVIKSTIPIGHTKKLREVWNTSNIIFSPEFLREGKSLEDNLYPSRIIVSNESKDSHNFAQLLLNSTTKKNAPVILMESDEAEAVKLFSNSYLAMRVSFFNELDTFALAKNLDTKKIIKGISYDKRIGEDYNNPSFGYGGYCLPKDTKQLLANYADIPQNIINSIVISNETRKEFIANTIIDLNPNFVGIYKLAMKEGSDNFRSSAIQDVMNHIQNSGKQVIIYEPMISDNTYEGYEVCNDLIEFKNKADIILANRSSLDLADVEDKVFTRDIFNKD